MQPRTGGGAGARRSRFSHGKGYPVPGRAPPFARAPRGGGTPFSIPPPQWGRSPGRDRSVGGRQRGEGRERQGVAGDDRKMAGQESDPPVPAAGGTWPGG